MKIIEVRDGFIKFEAEKNICLSSFIQIEGMTKSYIAQINSLRTFGNIVLASAKILFILIDNQLSNYDNTEPSTDSRIKTFTQDIINNSINAKRPVIIGRTLDNECSIKVDASAFDKKMLVSIDDKNMNNMLIRNLSKQFENLGITTVVIDTLGVISAKKYRAGVDFKLPLDTSSLAFMYESCLNDATAESKSTIIDIFKDLSEYAETVPFVPFNALKSIVDELVDKQHVFRLLVLKNKLAKFEKLGYFASKKEDVDNLQKILKQSCSVIDLSGLDNLFQNRYLNFIYEKLNEFTDVQVFLETANTVSKRSLKTVILDSKTPTTLITHSKFQYLNDMKKFFDNFIIEPTISNNVLFKVYSTFLSSMKKNMYLTAGEAINYIPIVSESQIIDELVEYKIEKEEVQIQSDTECSELSEEEPKLQNEDVSFTDEENEQENGDDEEIDFSEYINSEESTEVVEAIESEDLTAILEDQTDVEEDIKPEQIAEINDISTDNSDNDEYEEVVSKPSQEEIIATIDEKSDRAIALITEELEDTKELDIFKHNEETDIDVAQEEEPEFENIDSEEPELIEAEDYFENSEDSYEEMVSEEESSDDNVSINNLDTNLSEINDESVNIADVPDENIELDNTEIIQNIPAEELSEEMLEENIDTENVLPETNEAESINDINNNDIDNTDNISLEKNEEEVTIELDNDVENLLETTEDSTENVEEEYAQNTNLDVDFSEPQVMPLSGEALNHDFDEIVELDSSDANPDDIIVDMSGDEQINIDEKREQEILEEVDKVYTTMKDDNNDLEDISDSDLDLIDELNNDGEELEEYHGELDEVSDSDSGILDEVHSEPISSHNDAEEILEHKESSTPIVPLYDADIPQEDMVMSDPIQQGDTVVHAKYGNGVVEKMIKYGSKTLFAINFENIGRRLLDPTLTEIKRV